ncbi:MAG: bifunctional phosphoribosyl-AMP cyclohydrolase/phosphoribosyl-ATP diphosphatase HisIE [Acidobacteriota bacterium]
MSFALDPDSLVYDQRGLLPVVVQDETSAAVLMVAWADRRAVALTLETKQAHFYSRSRQSLWKKGETSGNVLDVVSVTPDCDRDTLLVRARPRGPACHRGTRTCFEPNPAVLELGWLWQVLDKRRDADRAQSYTARLLAGGVPKTAQKLGEEAIETVIAALSGVGGDVRTSSEDPGADAVADEAADLLYHLLALLLARGVSPAKIAEVLAARHRSRGASS